MIDGPYKNLKNGQRFYLFKPDPALIDIEYLAATISGINRFGGDANPFYSVGQHSVNCKLYIEHYYPDDYLSQMSALLHDTTEAFVNDIISIIKKFLFFKEGERFISFDEIENGIGSAIESALGHKIIYGRYKEADLALCVKEAEMRTSRAIQIDNRDFILADVPDTCCFREWSRVETQEIFLEHYHDLDFKIQESRAKTKSLRTTK